MTGFFPLMGGPNPDRIRSHERRSGYRGPFALTAAYNDAAGRTVNAITVSGDLTGLTLTSGLYTSTSSLGITGDVTLARWVTQCRIPHPGGGDPPDGTGSISSWPVARRLPTSSAGRHFGDPGNELRVH